MIIKICDLSMLTDLTGYLLSNKAEIVPAAVEPMYGNASAVGMRISQKMEIALLAIDEETNQVAGVISAISPGRDNNWTVVAFHVEESHRRKEVGTQLIAELKKKLLETAEVIKCSITLLKSNKPAAACMVMNDLEWEGNIGAIEPEKTITVFGAIWKRKG